jgi:HsdM N-terminal domain
MSDSISLSQLESHLWEAANILRGPVDAADFKTYVFPLLFFKRISDVYDEEYAAALAESGRGRGICPIPTELPLSDSERVPLERCTGGRDQRRRKNPTARGLLQSDVHAP